MACPVVTPTVPLLRDPRLLLRREATATTTTPSEWIDRDDDRYAYRDLADHLEDLSFCLTTA